MDPRKDWQIELIEAYPNLFHPLPGAPERTEGYPECGGGWHLLLESACSKIDGALDLGDTFRVEQIKEKYGTLRFYWDGQLSAETRKKVNEMVAAAEARSATTCEICGNEGKLYRNGGVYMTRCTTHAMGTLAG